MDKKLLKGINHVINDLKDKRDIAKTNKNDDSYFEGEFYAYDDSITFLERLISDYNKRQKN